MNATQKQIDYYLYLCEQSYVDPEEGYEDWSTVVMSDKIAELLEIVEG